MAVLIVTESVFGNTLTVACAVATGIAQAVGEDSVAVVGPADAPAQLPADLGLLVVGAPTHGFSMPRPQSRRQVAEKEAAPITETDSGVREWIQRAVPRPDLPAVSFDTSTKVRFQPGTASNAIFRALRRRGFRNAEKGPSFHVTGTEGPLADGETDRAEMWGARLGAALSTRTM
ncbi:flavodoxin family protein [Parafrankia discariae]|uniref:flavodoxin family protein n=1 Tax=Parafrankia discariae TaxID=365528 RepID=UPI0003691C2D|nr:hypothetical protein [Parafrankia discariae]